MVLAVTTTLEVAGLPPVRLREERDNEDVPLRTGCRVWSCARLLSAWLASACASGGSGGGADDADRDAGASFAPRVAGRDVLELGAGTGAVGLVCALLGARSVTMTDRDEATLALMHANARLNGHYDPDAACEVSARALDWGDLATYHARAYDLIVAADVLYLPEHCDALPAAAAAHLAPGGQLVVACGLRRAGLMERLVDAIRAFGLRPTVHRDALVLRDDDPRDAAAVTAAEHAHDGAQIAAAGGYVLVACEAPDDWSPPPDISADAVALARRRREEEDSESESESEDERDEGVVGETATRSVAAERDDVRGFADRERASAAAETPSSSSSSSRAPPRSLSDVGSDANSAMGEFLDDLADLDVEDDEPGAIGGGAHRRAACDDDREDEDDDNAAAADLPPYRVAASPDEISRGALAAASAAAAADSLARNGFVVLEASDGRGLVPADVLDEAAATSEAYLDALLDRCRARGIDPGCDIFRFAEVCGRARGGRRFDVTAERRRGRDGGRDGDPSSAIDIPARGPPAAAAKAAAAASAWDRVRRVVEQWTAPALALSGLMDPTAHPPCLGDAGETTAVGCVTAMPRAPRQHFHADGRIRGIVNCFAPLVDVPARLGPTRFKRGSHAWDHDAPYLTRAEERAREAAEEVAPELARGALLVYDYRTMHAGGANESDDERRPVAYVMRSRRGLEDTWNFPEESVWDEGEGGGGS